MSAAVSETDARLSKLNQPFQAQPCHQAGLYEGFGRSSANKRVELGTFNIDWNVQAAFLPLPHMSTINDDIHSFPTRSRTFGLSSGSSRIGAFIIECPN